MLELRNTHVRFSVPNANVYDECCAFLSLRDYKAITTVRNGKYSIVAYRLTNDEATRLLKIARQKRGRYVRRKRNAKHEHKVTVINRVSVPFAA